MNIQVYTTQTCPYCHAAKSLLKQRDLSYDEIDVTADPELRAELIQKTGRRTVPQIFIDGNSIGGFEELRRFFGRAA